MTSISAISRLYCAQCKAETLHNAGVCSCGTRYTVPPITRLTVDQLMTFNYQQHPGSRPARRK